MELSSMRRLNAFYVLEVSVHDGLVSIKTNVRRKLLTPDNLSDIRDWHYKKQLTPCLSTQVIWSRLTVHKKLLSTI